MVSAWNRGRAVDRVWTWTSLTLYSMPEWWLGLLLIAAFAVGVGPMPGHVPHRRAAVGRRRAGTLGYVLDTAWHLTLPVITLTLAYLADYSLIMRSSLLDEIGEDYLMTARAKGLRDIDVRRRHAVPQRAAAHHDVVALNIGFVVSGAITIETVFSIPGLGLLATEALEHPRLLGAPGRVPGRLGRGHPRQPGREPPLRRSSTRGCAHERRTDPSRPYGRRWPAAGVRGRCAAPGRSSASTAPASSGCACSPCSSWSRSSRR